jgi:2-keto-4-pentenoate hydratase
MDPQDIDRLAAELLAAEHIQDVPTLSTLASERRMDLTLEDAYAVQRSYAELRAAAGDAPVGRKVAMLGAKPQREAGATEPVAGRMFASGRLADGGDLQAIAGDRAIVECELAFVLGADLRGPGITVDDVIGATAELVPAFEIVEHRSPAGATIHDRITVNHSAGFVLGTNTLDPREVDRVHTELRFEADGELISTGPLGGALGDPALVVVWLADRLASLGEHLHAGDIVLTGKIVPDVPATSARTFRAVCGGGLGSISVTGLG